MIGPDIPRGISREQKYEFFLQLVRQEVRMAAEAWKVDRTTISRIRTWWPSKGAVTTLSAALLVVSVATGVAITVHHSNGMPSTFQRKNST
jgi:hypothetical protein